MERKDVISIAELAKRFSKAKGLGDCGYQWLRQAPGRSANKDEKVGNSLAIMKAIRAFNTANKSPIVLYKATGYDNSPARTTIMAKADILRLKGFIVRSSQAKKPRGKSAAKAAFKIVGKVEA